MFPLIGIIMGFCYGWGTMALILSDSIILRIIGGIMLSPLLVLVVIIIGIIGREVYEKIWYKTIPANTPNSWYIVKRFGRHKE